MTVLSAMTALTPVGGVGATRVRVHVPFDLRHSADLRQGFVTAIREGSELLVDISDSTVVDRGRLRDARRSARPRRPCRSPAALHRCRRADHPAAATSRSRAPPRRLSRAEPAAALAGGLTPDPPFVPGGCQLAEDSSAR
uniref:Uncharacterized protein n=1 Tax=Janibacter limosus TaxID=53458 RepID=A0AC61U6H7_9MICO|nr:hypothetical protein [Janibacter limosus]